VLKTNYRFYAKLNAIAPTIYLLKAIAIAVSRDLWGDRFNDIFSKGFPKVIDIIVNHEFCNPLL
jgi:hypothetical protein